MVLSEKDGHTHVGGDGGVSGKKGPPEKAKQIQFRVTFLS